MLREAGGSMCIHRIKRRWPGGVERDRDVGKGVSEF